MIFTEPLQSKSAVTRLNAYRTIFDKLTARGLRPQLQRMDNEASTLLTQFLTNNGVTHQLTTPQMHRRNMVERAIRVFKNHFIAGLCRKHPNFPLHLWD
jgi:hypothetical protein